MGKSTWIVRVAAGSLVAMVLGATAASSVGAKGAGRADSGVVYLAVTHTVGDKQFAAGNSQDKLFGTGSVTYVNIAKSTPSGTIKVTTKPVVLYYKNGTLTGTATSELTVGQNGAATISDGKLTAAKGTGGQKGHSVSVTFTGAGSITTATYKITYKGTYR